jgi:hypothetical protein
MRGAPFVASSTTFGARNHPWAAISSGVVVVNSLYKATPGEYNIAMNRKAGKPTTGMLLVEARYGIGIRPMLVRLYRQHDSMQRIADELGFTRQTVYNWMRVLGLDLDSLKLAAAATGSGLEPQELLLDVWRKHRSVRRASQHLRVGLPAARRWLIAAGIPPEDLDNAAKRNGGENAHDTADA